MAGWEFLWLWFPLFVLYGCVLDVYATELLTDFTEGAAEYRQYRFHHFSLFRRTILPERVARFMDGRSLLFPFIELGAGIFLTACMCKYGLFSLGMARCVLGASILFVACLINVKTRVLPAEYTNPLIGCGLLFAVIEGVFVDLSILRERLAGLLLAILWAEYAVRRLGGWILEKEAYGLGDVHLCAGVGLLLGWDGFLVFFFCFCIFGAIEGRVVLLRTGQSMLATGPAYILAFLVVVPLPYHEWQELGLAPLFLPAMWACCAMVWFAIRLVRRYRQV